MKSAARAGVFILLLAAPSRAAIGDDPNSRILRVERWLKATLNHQPGATDDAAREISLWSNAELRDLFTDQAVLAQLMRNPVTRNLVVPTAGPRAMPPYTNWQLHRLRVLACVATGALDTGACVDLKASDDLDPTLFRLANTVAAAIKRGENGFVLRRGALLHSDIAMAGSPDAGGPGETGRIRVTVADGESTGVHATPVHWESARMLLDGLKPGPGDVMVRQWYVATAAWMQKVEQHDTIHLRHARELFPDDADVNFFSGCQQEAYASPAIQAVLKTAVLPTGFHLDVQSESAALRDAETFFRKTLTAKSEHSEARLRLGRVLLLRGRAQEAAADLRRVGPWDDEPLLQYFSAMFLGAAEEASGRFDEARAAYLRAAMLQPDAQSPYLALSALAARRRDRTGALREIERLFALPPAEERHTTDPWWVYRVVQSRHVDDLFEALYAPMRDAR